MNAVFNRLESIERAVAPVVDLIIRVLLGQAFFVSGIVKLANWDAALHLARYEYPVAWMDPVTAAVLGVAIELAGGLALMAGFATRVAAAALLALALVIQFNYRALDVHLLWALVLGWYVARGAGAISLDRMLRGLGSSALPLARPIAAALGVFTRFAAPTYQLVIRLFIAVAVFGGAMSSAQGFNAVLVALIAVGLATRAAALVLAVVAALSALPLWAVPFVLLVLHGPGPISIDALIAAALKRYFPGNTSLEGLPHVVIVGAGFGGIACARALARAPVRITLIDRHNYHLFQPLLYQVATTALAPGDIAMPVRGIFRDQSNARVVLGTVNGVDTKARTVRLEDRAIGYDWLVLATGAAHSYFGRDEWAPFAPGLKRVEDATEVRRRVLTAFERAELAKSDEERKRWLTFLVVGAGPTGVELAGAIAELARLGMEKDFRSFDPAQARILLVQSGPRVLPTFPEKLSAITSESLAKLGVEVLLDSRVESIDAEGVVVSGKRIPAKTVLWAAGVVASPAAKWVGGEHDNAGRLKVGADLAVAGCPNVFAVGDTALANAWDGKPVPGLAPAAKQGGMYVAQVIRACIAGRPRPAAFRYRHLGSLATIGRKAAVADFGFMRLWGAPAWWLWGAIHVGFLVGMRNRVSVLLDWFWSYVTFQSGTRLITGAPEPAPVAKPAARPAVAA